MKSHLKINPFGAEIMEKGKKKRGFALELSGSKFQNKHLCNYKVLSEKLKQIERYWDGDGISI